MTVINTPFSDTSAGCYVNQDDEVIASQLGTLLLEILNQRQSVMFK